MNKLLIISIPLAIILASCKGQNIASSDVPSVVLNTLKSKNPVTTDIEWEKHGNIFEAEFEINDSTEASVRIDESGRLLMQKQDIPVSELSPEITTAIQSQYQNYRLDDIERLEKDGMIYYQVELKAKRKKEINLVMSQDGKENKSFSFWE